MVVLVMKWHTGLSMLSTVKLLENIPKNNFYSFFLFKPFICVWAYCIYMNTQTKNLTSPVILSWQPKLRPVSVLPSSKCNLANADGGLVSSPDWVAINRVEAESLVRLIPPLVEMRFRNAVLRAAFSMDDMMMTWYICIAVLLGLIFVLWKRLLSW